jgi:hypothetical protein
VSTTDDVLTEDLLRELLESPSAQHFVERHDSTDLNLSDYLDTLLVQKKLRKIDVIHQANLNETFGYQIFSGDRNPKRDKVLQLAFAFPCTVRETQRLLKHAGANELYPKNRRDAIILFALEHAQSLQQTDALLYRFGEDTIQSEGA